MLPGLADRLVKMAETQSLHRMELEKIVIRSQQSQSSVGQWLGFAIALVCIGMGSFLVYSGHSSEGAGLMGGTLISLVGVFVYGKYQQKKDLASKRQLPEIKRQ